jgi:hypothetical protein
MSARLMGHVVEHVHGLATGEKLTLVILANYADEHDECWPSFNTLSKRVGINRRNTIKVMGTLEAKGLISRVEERPYKPTKYRLHIPSTSVTYDTSDASDTSVVSDTIVVSPVTLPSVVSDTRSSVASDTLSLSKPLKTPQRTLRGENTPRVIDPDWEPSTGLLEWAVKEFGCSERDLRRESKKFVSHFDATGKRYLKWDQAWRNWIRRAVEEYGSLKASRNPRHECPPGKAWDASKGRCVSPRMVGVVTAG